MSCQDQSFNLANVWYFEEEVCLSPGLRTTPAKGCDITLGCVVLHDIGIERNDILNMDEEYVNHGNINFNVRDEWDGRNVCQSFFT